MTTSEIDFYCAPPILMSGPVAQLLIVSFAASVLIAMAVRIRRRRIGLATPSVPATTAAEHNGIAISVPDETDTEFEDAVTEAVNQACKDLRELAEYPWSQMSAWHLADVVTEAAEEMRGANPRDNAAGVLFEALMKSIDGLISCPASFHTYTAALHACNQVDIATEATRRELKLMWSPPPYAFTPQVNSTPGTLPAQTDPIEGHPAAHQPSRSSL
jgi:hypothetical protein